MVINQLAAVCGENHVREATAADAVAGVAARWVVAPATTDEVSATLKVVNEHCLTVVVRGAGTKLDWGLPPSTVDVVLDCGRLSGVTAYEPGDLVLTAGAGTPLLAIQEAIAPAGQRLALDPGSMAAGATVGGVLASGEAGPLRMRFGAGRDLLIGVEFVRADGVVAHAGGRVVKNVAGYDLGKLLCGSYGTLGVITSATFRLHPIPAVSRWVCRSVRTPVEVHHLLGMVFAAPVVPTAIDLDLPGLPPPLVPRQRGPAGLPRTGTLAVLLEGTAEGVAARSATVVGLLGGDASVMDSPPQWWGGYPFTAGQTGLKLAVPIADLEAAVSALRDAAGGPVPVRGSAGAAVVFAALPGDTPSDRVAAVLDAVRTALARRGGSCVVLCAPPAVRDAVDVWGPVPGLALMRRVKDQFDPRRLLSPGRFVGGL